MSVNYMTVGELIEILSQYPNDTVVVVPRPQGYEMQERTEWDGPEHFWFAEMRETWDVFVDASDDDQAWPRVLKLSPVSNQKLELFGKQRNE